MLVSLLAGFVAGCDDETKQPETVLRVANWGGAQVESAFMKLERQIISEFEAAHPGVRVQVEQIPGYGQYAPKLMMMHVTGSVPDVIHLDASSAAVFMDNHVLRDLAPLVESDRAAGTFTLDDYFENVVKIARRGDRLYAIPLDFTPMVIYYNKRLFDEQLFSEQVAEAELRVFEDPSAETGADEQGERAGQPTLLMQLNEGHVPAAVREAFFAHGFPLAADAACMATSSNRVWQITSGSDAYTLRKDASDRLGAYRPEGISAYPRPDWTWKQFLATAEMLTAVLSVKLPEDDRERASLIAELDAGRTVPQLVDAFERYGLARSPRARLAATRAGRCWTLNDHGIGFTLRREVRAGAELLNVYLADYGGNPTLVRGFSPKSVEGASLDPEKLELRGPSQYGLFFENVMPFWVLWLWTNGGDVLSPEGTRGSGYFDSPQSIEAVQFLVDLMTEYRVAPHLKESAAAGVDLFRAERAAMDLKGHWMMIDYRADGLDFGVVGLPTNGVGPVTVVYEAGLAITQEAKHPDLAWEYIKHVASANVQERRVASGLAISGNQHAAAKFAGNPVEDAFIDVVQHARPPWGASVERYPFIEELGREMMEDILYSDGELSVGDAMKQTAKLIDAALREQ